DRVMRLPRQSHNPVGLQSNKTAATNFRSDKPPDCSGKQCSDGETGQTVAGKTHRSQSTSSAIC
ncbi:hypothetical protein, partial [Burkholderia cenocepacia]|uniref:hypothetical protein n=1 Tax=Burkholderia cenocepacia TaxID=95486 RepID=UPI001C0E065D